MRHSPSISVLVASALIITACGGESESSSTPDAEIEMGGDSTVISNDEGSVQIVTDDDGNVEIEALDDDGNVAATILGGSQIPSDWPASIPVPANVEIQMASQMPMPEGMEFAFIGLVKGDSMTVMDQWTADLSANGFVPTEYDDSSDFDHSFIFESTQYRIEGFISLADMDGALQFSVKSVG